jgi:hypothetical protein
MALPRYQNIGVQAGGSIDSLPRIDFPNRGEATRGFDAISNALDVMSGAFFKEAQIAATEEGERYGAENAPTQEQLRLAVQTETPLPKVGDSRTFFGRAAQNAYSNLLVQQVNFSAKQDIAKIQDDAANGRIRVADILPQMNSVIRGYTSAISDADPVLARRTQAILAYEGNNAYLAATKAAASRAAAAARDQDIVAAIRLVQDVKTDFESGDVKEGDQGPILPISEKIKIRQQQIDSIANRLPPKQAKQLIDSFNKEVTGQQQEYLFSWAVSGATPEERQTRVSAIDSFFATKKLDQNIDPTGEVTRVMKSMDPVAVRETRSVVGQWTSYQDKQDQAALIKRQAEVEAAQENAFIDVTRRMENARRGQGDMPTLDEVFALNLPMGGNNGVNKMALITRLNSQEFGPVKRDNNVYQDLYERITLPDGDPRKIRGGAEVRQAVVDRRIDTADEQRLLKIMRDVDTPQGRAENNAIKTFLRGARNTIEQRNPMTGVIDPLSAQNYVAFEQEFYRLLEDRKAKGLSVIDFLDPNVRDSAWTQVKSFQRSPQEILQDQLRAMRQTEPTKKVEPRNPGESIADWKKRTGQ